MTNEGNRVAVQFTKVVIQLRLLFIPTPFLKVVAKPNGTLEKEGRVPDLDVTYVSDALRVSCGGDGSLLSSSARLMKALVSSRSPARMLSSRRRDLMGVTGKVENV